MLGCVSAGSFNIAVCTVVQWDRHFLRVGVFFACGGHSFIHVLVVARGSYHSCILFSIPHSSYKMYTIQLLHIVYNMYNIVYMYTIV